MKCFSVVASVAPESVHFFYIYTYLGSLISLCQCKTRYITKRNIISSVAINLYLSMRKVIALVCTWILDLEGIYHNTTKYSKSRKNIKISTFYSEISWFSIYFNTLLIDEMMRSNSVDWLYFLIIPGEVYVFF